jgi:hypothetical protein
MSDHRLTFILLPDLYGVCRLGQGASFPEWATGEFVSITRTSDELSVICLEKLIPDAVRCERGWRSLRVAGSMEFSLIGVVASFVKPLAEAGISVFVISTFDTDYLLVKENDLANVVSALHAAGHSVT